MTNIILSKMEIVADTLAKEIQFNKNEKVLIIPWAFPLELDEDRLVNEYFKVGEARYNKYVGALIKLGLKEENMEILNCYSKNVDFKNKIANADIIFIPGGNPEMLLSKIMHATRTFYDLKDYKGIFIGESAGAVMQFERYFISKEHNYYEYQAFYDGFGNINDPFFIDVHTLDNKEYLENLKNLASKVKKDIYAIYNEGAIIYDKENNDLKIVGKVLKFEK